MRQTLIVSSDGEVTLPAEILRRLGVEGGGVVLLEDRGHEIALKPDAAYEFELYADEQVAAWSAADRLEEGERECIVGGAAQVHFAGHTPHRKNLRTSRSPQGGVIGKGPRLDPR